MSKWLNLRLLLFCLVCHSGNFPVGNTPVPVIGKKGGNATLLCKLEASNILTVELRNQTDDIPVCQTKECSGRVFQEGSCDVIIKDLRLSDAGKYFLSVYNDTDQPGLKPQIRTYYLHIHGEISVKTGEELKLDVLLSNTDKVEKNSSGEWTEVWTRGHGVSSDRLTVSDVNLIIKEFMATDAGTYRVLDSKGEIWITVTVTESSPESGSKGVQKNTKDTVKNWSLIAGVSVGFGVLVVGAAVALIIYCVMHQRQRNQQMRRQHQQGNMPHNYEMAPVQDPVHN